MTLERCYNDNNMGQANEALVWVANWVANIILLS